LSKELQPFLSILSKDGKQTETVKELTNCLQAYKEISPRKKRVVAKAK